MATLKATLTLQASAGQVSTNALSLTESDSLTVDAAPSVSNNRLSIAHGSATVLVASSVSAVTHIYIKNTDTTNFVTVKTDGGTAFAKLTAGEWLWLPINPSTGIEVQADTAACIVEYSYYTKS